MKSKSIIASILMLSLLFIGLVPLSSSAADNEFPGNKPIEYVIHSSPGGGMNLASRFLGDLHSEELGTTAKFTNQPGASGEIATKYVLRQPADGYTLYPVNSITLAFLTAIQEPLGEGVSFNDKFDWIGSFAVDAKNLVVNKDSQWKTFKEFVQYAQENEVSIATPHLTMPGTVAAYQMKDMGLKVNHVPYDGSPEAMSDLLGGHIDALISTTISLQRISDQLRFLAQFQDKNEQKDLTQDAPTAKSVLKEMGVMGKDDKLVNVASIRAFMAPKGVQDNYPERFKKIVDAYNRANGSKDWNAMAEARGLAPILVDWGPEKSKKEYTDMYESVKKYRHLFED